MKEVKDILGKGRIKRRPEGFAPHREKLHDIIFEADTKAGKAFDVVLLVMIFFSIIVLMLESIPAYETEYKALFFKIELGLTVFFTIEYLLRIYSVYKPRYYIISFFGIIDFLSILPFYLALFIPSLQTLMIVRSLRLLRIFRIFKLDAFIDQGNFILSALKESAKKIVLFSFTMLILIMIFGSIMYLVEHNVNENFDSIPRSIYWAVVTITTVGYGDISPVTAVGQFIASLVMLTGYVIIAVPTGIITANVMRQDTSNDNLTKTCPFCLVEGHESNANYCYKCGHDFKE
ncbi:MAG: ion transporter [Saprospiraceae bacterium]